jgi:hypothetical protein
VAKDELEFRDLNKADDKPYLTKPTSQVDLETRLEDGYKPDSDVSDRRVVNPNPFGAEDYASTDPIYQNHANDTEKPYRAEEGADKQAEQVVRDLHDLDGLDDSEVTEDHGMGGKAQRADQTGAAGPTRYLVPGQEGYDQKTAEQQNLPPMRVDSALAEDDEDEDAVPPPPTPEDPRGASVNPNNPPQA